MSGAPQRIARNWTRGPDGSVCCQLCPHQCTIDRGRSGVCRVRTNHDGQLLATTYGVVSSLALDPVEKKPLYHYYPGHTVLSVGSTGCNLHCSFCQNWRIVHCTASTHYLGPDELVDLASSRRSDRCIGIAYTYNEPITWHEYVLDASLAARRAGLKNVLVTNGFCLPQPWAELMDVTDACNIDLKAMDPGFYRQICGGWPGPVMESVAAAFAARVHVEVTNLLVTGDNDSPQQVAQLATWLASISPDIPLHLSRYLPNYNYLKPSTPMDTMRRAASAAREYLRYVYLGNTWPAEDVNTLCYNCGQIAIIRDGFQASPEGLAGNRCMGCGSSLALVLGPAGCENMEGDE